MITERTVDQLTLEHELRRRLAKTPWWVGQLLPTPEGVWVVEIRHQDTALRLAYTDEDRLTALRRAVEAAEGRG